CAALLYPPFPYFSPGHLPASPFPTLSLPHASRNTLRRPRRAKAARAQPASDRLYIRDNDHGLRRSLPCGVPLASGTPDGKAGSVNRPASCIGAIFDKSFDLVIVEVVSRKNAVFVFINLEEDDRRHQRASEVPGVVLCEAEFLHHRCGSRGRGDHSPLDRRPSGPAGAAIIAMAKP